LAAMYDDGIIGHGRNSHAAASVIRTQQIEFKSNRESSVDIGTDEKNDLLLEIETISIY